MKRFLILAAMFAAATEAQAGFRCGGHVRQKRCQTAETKCEAKPVRKTAAKIVSLPSRVVEAQPVRTIFNQTVSDCQGGRCFTVPAK